MQTRDIQRMIHDFLVGSRPDKHINSSLDAVERILFASAKHCLKIKNVKRRYTRKHRDPLNITLRENYHTVLKQYKTF